MVRGRVPPPRGVRHPAAGGGAVAAVVQTQLTAHRPAVRAGPGTVVGPRPRGGGPRYRPETTAPRFRDHRGGPHRPDESFRTPRDRRVRRPAPAATRRGLARRARVGCSTAGGAPPR